MRVAVLDDNPSDAQRLVDYLEQYQREHGLTFQTDTFLASLDFLEEYRGGYDVIFLDIEMPGSDGLEVAHEIRSKDESVGILFITNMAQYAIRGYEVDAVDFMVKPVGYHNFAQKLQKAIRFAKKRDQRFLLLSSKDGLCRIGASEILYIEKDKNYLVYHTRRGSFRELGSIQGAREKLERLPFSECTSGCLVNLSYVDRVGKESVLVNTEELPLSRRMKKRFIQDYIDFVGGGF
ncbi:MAG: LytR/AlgR family response regulator transcription factor [Candidatus Onthomonas sp.]